MSNRNKRKILILVFSLIAMTYILSYLIISRRGYLEADQCSFKGFYYFPPEDTDVWRRKNYGCALFYCPINVIDQWLGTGRAPAKEPMFGLSK